MRFLKSILIGMLSISIILAISAFLFKDRLFQYILNKKIEAFETKYNCKLKLQSASLNGISGFSLKELSLAENAKAPLVKIASINGEIALSEFVLGNLALSELEITDGSISALKQNGSDNYSFLLKSKKNTDTTATTNYAATLNKLLSRFFKQVPEQFSLQNFSIQYADSLSKEALSIPSFTLTKTQLNGSILSLSNDAAKWIFSGSFDKKHDKLNVSITSKSEYNLPFLLKKFQLEFGFNTVQVTLNEKDFTGGELNLKGLLAANGLRIKHPKLDSNEVAIQNGQLQYDLLVGEKSISFSKETSGKLNNIAFTLEALVNRNKPEKYNLKIQTPFIESQDFISSLPEGLFSNFKGMKVSGQLALNGNFSLDMSNIDSVQFDCNLASKDFKILEYGESNFSKLNTSFLYTAYEKELPVKTFPVGPEYAYFTPIDTISEYLKNAILISEDGSFFWHKGFRADAFQKALAENIKKRKFARGGSTISMQLVKNLFLSRRKTIARKVEEALIVWLIEQNKVSSKKRMYEIYLNIIEWGPGIYGVGEASKYYFNKHPSQLSIEESIYMASIIPRPKYFKYSFDEGGNLKPHLESYYNRVGRLLARKGIITAQQDSALAAKVILSGPARNLVVKEAMPADTLSDIEEDFGF